MCALFVLFDQVIILPDREDTKSNLALLDIAAGHFSRIEYASNGSLPGSLVAEFAYIARQYVNETAIERQQHSFTGDKPSSIRNDGLSSTLLSSDIVLPPGPSNLLLMDGSISSGFVSLASIPLSRFRS